MADLGEHKRLFLSLGMYVYDKQNHALCSVVLPFSTEYILCKSFSLLSMRHSVRLNTWISPRCPQTPVLCSIKSKTFGPLSRFVPPIFALAHEIRQIPLETLALDLERADTLEEELVTLKLACALDAEDEVVA